MALIVISMALSVTFFIFATAFIGMVFTDIDNTNSYLSTPISGIILLMLIPSFGYIASAIAFKTWYDFDRKKKGIPLR